MTQRSQKQDELRFATAAARLMNMQWMLVAREEYDGGPDFIVHEGTHGFGPRDIQRCDYAATGVKP